MLVNSYHIEAELLGVAGLGSWGLGDEFWKDGCHTKYLNWKNLHSRCLSL